MISENALLCIRENVLTEEVIKILLTDRTTGKNIIWATDDYARLGGAYAFDAPVLPELFTGENEDVIKPRTEKDRESQTQRSKDMAEVFTPLWVCNAQNNLVDDAWFGQKRKRFNTEKPESWVTNYYKINFPPKTGKTWEDYVRANRLEIACGEAPYLTSRYDTVTGAYIPVKTRIGLLDRKLRVTGENVTDWRSWIKWAKIALRATYGFEWQGDNLLIARENLLLTTAEHYCEKYGRIPANSYIKEFAKIISWNVFQMDGIKFVIPETCHDVSGGDSFWDDGTVTEPCPGCKYGERLEHNGIYAQIMDWEQKKPVRFVDLLKGENLNV